MALSFAVLLGVLMYESYMGELTVWIVFPNVAICYRLSPLIPLNRCLTAIACLSRACSIAVSRASDLALLVGYVAYKAGFRLSIPSLDASVNLVHETLPQTQLPSTVMWKKKTVFFQIVFFMQNKQAFFFWKKKLFFIFFFFLKYGININAQVETTLLWDLFSIYDTVSNYFTSLLLI